MGIGLSFPPLHLTSEVKRYGRALISSEKGQSTIQIGSFLLLLFLPSFQSQISPLPTHVESMRIFPLLLILSKKKSIGPRFI